MAGPLIIDSFGGKSLHEQSHGESFFALFLNRLRGNGLYFFDEPEAALSPTRQLSFLSRLHDLVKDGSQFLIATHSPILMAYPDASILMFENVVPEMSAVSLASMTSPRPAFTMSIWSNTTPVKLVPKVFVPILQPAELL